MPSDVTGGDWGGRGDEESAAGLPHFLSDPLGVLQRRWRWMLLGAGVGVVATVVAVASWTPMFTATATMLVSSQKIPEDFVRSTVREDTLANVDATLGRLLAQERLAQLIQDLDLYPRDLGREPTSQLVARIRDSIELEPFGPFSGGRNASSLVYGLSFEHPDPELAAAAANALAALFMEASIEQRSKQARRTTEFLRRALERVETEMRGHTRALSEFRNLHRGDLPDELATNLHKLEMMVERRKTLTDQIALKQNRIATLYDDPGVRERSENEALLDALRRQLAQELAANTDLHPNVVALRERVARLTELVKDERSVRAAPSEQMQRVVASEEFELSKLRSALSETEAEIASLSAHVDRTPVVGEQLAGLMEKEQVLRENYLSALRKVEEAELAESLESAQQGAQVTQLDEAQAPPSPDRPRWMIAAAGVAGTLALALASAVLLELFDPVVVNARQLEQLSSHPVLGSVPRAA